MSSQTAKIYFDASATFAGECVSLIYAEHWQWVLAIVMVVIVVAGVLIPEVPQFMSQVVNPEGHSALGQRIFGAPSAAN